MLAAKKQRIEFGDFQTPDTLAVQVCALLRRLGISPDEIVEPTCGVGAFVVAAASEFREAKAIFGYEINESYLDELRLKLDTLHAPQRVVLEAADFFATDWKQRAVSREQTTLVLGNFPWVTSSTLGAIGGANAPEKSNFMGFNGFDAVTGKANFDISEWMLLEVVRWFSGRSGDIAMLVKTAVARKVLAQLERRKEPVQQAYMFGIDAKKSFGAAVDACLLVVRLNPQQPANYDYTAFKNLDDPCGRRVGHRLGMSVGDLQAFEKSAFLLGKSPEKWRSGIKHDASGVMEFTRTDGGYENGFGEVVELEDAYLFPLLKGSDIGSDKKWREKFVLVTQRHVGESTDAIHARAPKTWAYLEAHATQLDARGSIVYEKNPRFSIFGVGDYAFRPWRIAICALYKALNFRLIGPMGGDVVMFDDTVYYLSFDTEKEAVSALKSIRSSASIGLLSSLIFWDEKRPIKTGVLNLLDWSRLQQSDEIRQAELI